MMKLFWGQSSTSFLPPSLPPSPCFSQGRGEADRIIDGHLPSLPSSLPPSLLPLLLSKPRRGGLVPLPLSLDPLPPSLPPFLPCVSQGRGEAKNYRWAPTCPLGSGRGRWAGRRGGGREGGRGGLVSRWSSRWSGWKLGKGGGSPVVVFVVKRERRGWGREGGREQGEGTNIRKIEGVREGRREKGKGTNRRIRRLLAPLPPSLPPYLPTSYLPCSLDG